MTVTKMTVLDAIQHVMGQSMDLCALEARLRQQQHETVSAVMAISHQMKHETIKIQRTETAAHQLVQ